MVDVIIRKTLVKVKYFWYFVALVLIIDNVDPGPDLSKGILILFSLDFLEENYKFFKKKKALEHTTFTLYLQIYTT